ncbi:MAG: hypothetical protein AAGA31_19605, partial [Bacteroidota bacterium]
RRHQSRDRRSFAAREPRRCQSASVSRVDDSVGALCQQADLLLLDEPFVGVDIPTEEKIIEVLRRLSEEGKTLMVVHHDLQAVPDYFDHVVLLNQRLIASGPTQEVFTPDILRQAFGGQLAVLQELDSRN